MDGNIEAYQRKLQEVKDDLCFKGIHLRERHHPYLQKRSWREQVYNSML
jgi:hypothetical protein